MDYMFLCKALAKAHSFGVRLYQNSELMLYTSLPQLEPDPVLPYISEMLCRSEPAGIYTTPLFQLYAYFDTVDKQRIVIGPTSMPTDDIRQLEILLFLLNIPPSEKESYVQKLHCMPSIPLERFVWILGVLVVAVNHAPFSIENIFMNRRPELHQQEIVQKSTEKALLTEDDIDAAQIVQGSYAYEKMLLSYVQNGQSEQLQEVLDAGMNIQPGEMAKDVLRQMKNGGICGATVASRAAIAGGLDSKTAFGLSDLYIQKLEILEEYGSITHLTNDMFIEFAHRVKLAKYCVTSESHFFKTCARYISEHITSALSTCEISDVLHLSRSYLCTRFKSETGITLSQYILQEKAEEAKRLLCYTDKSLSEISVHLSFSSQSHFQNSFKKATGQTPMEYRSKNR